ncbi:M23 family metallopeptidase [Streptomyces sp. NPDC057116]|uniref:M23 family metallopeptidase n=1 Tax=Streptomyces sp. NPDC057116 TaxID=3346023 RepID=UPI00363A9637
MVLVALAVLLALLPLPAAAADGPGGAATEVARLYDEAARATEAYERGRRAAAAQRAVAGRLQRELILKRRELAVLNDRMGEVARAQYRAGGSLGLTARLLMADDPDEAMLAERLARQADRAVNRLMERTRAAERRLARAEGDARAAWRDLDVRRKRLAAIRRGVEARLERAQGRLQAEADRRVAAGRCGRTAWAGGAWAGGASAGVGVGGAAHGGAGASGSGGTWVSGAVRGGAWAGGAPAGGGRAGARGWVAPVEGYALSAGFHRRGAHWARRHTGQDFAVAVGTPVRSIGAGRVQSVNCGGAFGIEVVVRHSGGWYSQYAHLAVPGVSPGQPVAAGQPIGRSGNTGNSTGPHLHFEVRITPYMGSAVDPVRWLGEHGVRLSPSGH